MADYEVVNGVAIITCQHPPVNQLSYRLRLGLFSGLEKGHQDPSVQAIVIIGGGRTFPAGADVKEFSTGEGFKKSVPQFIDALDNATKPVIAAIHGTALGGGLEIALACHYRIGTSRCKVGFPEVLLGLLPGAGGTQRLPRLIGPMLATEMVVSGQQVKAGRARDIGILDDLVHIEPNHHVSMEQLILRSSAVQFAQKVAARPIADRVLSRRKCTPLNDFFYDQIRAMTKKSARGFMAPELNLQAVRAAHTEPTFKAGIKKERELFMKLIMGDQSKSLQHIFFAQRQISKVPGVDAKKARPIRSVGIVGCGTMGGGILMNFVQIGIPVVVLEMKQQFLDKGLGVVKANWMRKVKKGKLSKAKLQQYMSLIRPTLRYEDFADVDLVIEAVFENMEIKKKVFTTLDRVCKPSCILASNTSFLDVGEIAAMTSRPGQVVGTHFFAPANQMQLLENIRHPGTDEVTIATVQNVAKLIKKKGVLVGVCEGFVGNRLFSVEGCEANRLLEEGATIEQIDKVCYDFGFPMGIFRVSDLSGNDIGYRLRDGKGIIKDPSKRPLPNYYPYTLADRLVEMNRLGMKVGKGFYDYEGRKATASKAVQKMAEDISREKGIARRQVTDQEIIERLFYTMVNEGLKVLEEGIAIRPSDVDVVLVFGYGFPAYRGGIMFWGDLVGMKKIRKALLKYSAKYPEVPHFQPAALLNELVEKKMSLAKYWKKRSKKGKL